jgi:hypothetical protein
LTSYGSQGDDEKYADSGYMLKVEVTGIDSRLNMWVVRKKRGIKHDL